MIGAGNRVTGEGVADERAEAALHAVAHDGVADLLRHGEADADSGVIIASRSNEQDEAGHGRALAAVGGKEVGALAKGD
jgi:hypothetical protein